MIFQQRSHLRSVALCIVVMLAALLSAVQLFGWGFWAHKEITRAAIELLPAEMKPLFAANVEYLRERSVEPDIRRRSDSLEQFYHYLDIDYYGEYPFDELPRDLEAAIARYGIDAVRKQGLVPWRIVEFTESLTVAMKRMDVDAVLLYAGELSHYLADSHVPLHTVVDYDGVRRGQRGIHRRWETQLPERFGSAFQYPTEGRYYIDDPLAHAFEIVLESYTFAESVFVADAEALRRAPGARTFESVRRDGDTVYTYSDEFFRMFKELDRGLFERRMQKAIIRVASFWYTAWVNAGKPVLKPRE